MVVVLGALSAFGPLSLDLYLPGLPELADDLGASASAAQLTLTACLLGLAVGQLLSGPWSDAVGRRRPLVIGVGAYVAASLACAVAPSILTLIGLRFVRGGGRCRGDRRRARHRPRPTVGRRGGAPLRRAPARQRCGAYPLAGPRRPAAAPHRLAWAVRRARRGRRADPRRHAALVPESHPPALRRAGGLSVTLRVFRELLGERRFVGCTLASGLAFAAMFAYIAGSPFVLQDIYSLSPAQFSAVFAANAIGITAAGQLASRLIERLGPRFVLGTGLLTGAGGGVALLGVVLLGGIGLVGILPALFLVVASIGAVFPSSAAIALEGHPSTAGSASALLGLAQFAIGAICAPLVGLAGEDTAVPMAVVIVICGLGAVAAFWSLVGPDNG